MSERQSFEYRDFMPAQLARLATLAQGVLASALSRCGMTIAHWRILICLTERGPSTLNAIVAFTHLPQSSLSRSVARLEERGAVAATRDARDGRRVVITITDAGRVLLTRAGELVDARCAEAFAMEPDEMEMFRSTLSDLLARFAPVREAAGAR